MICVNAAGEELIILRELNLPEEGLIMSDRSLRQNIVDELEFEPSIDAANIGVAVDRGIVTLTGVMSG